MMKEIDITIRNRLTAGERDINVFHYSTRSAHIISHNSSVTLPLQNFGNRDYLYISVVRGPGYLWTGCIVSLPLWADFEFSSEGSLVLTYTGNGRQFLIKIPPGPPTWELKITRPGSMSSPGSLMGVHAKNVTIGDNGIGEGG